MLSFLYIMPRKKPFQNPSKSPFDLKGDFKNKILLSPPLSQRRGRGGF
jgi:hypothetical protein